MKTRSLARICVVTIVAMLAVSRVEAQSLADVAKREADRRGSAPATGKVYTNGDLTADFTNPSPAPAPAPSATSAKSEPAAATEEVPQTPVAEPGTEVEQQAPSDKGEDYWRRKATAIRTAIAAQEAQIEQAQAGVASAEANLRNAEIVTPISGVLTQLDAKVGQLATPGTPLVSIISASGFEVDAGVSETDIGKLSVGDKASMTLDAFSGETFSGTVFYIAPAETNDKGVISYLVKISFDKPDARLKSGLTANIDIQAKKNDNVLILPQYAILQNDNGTFVQTLVKGVATTSSVTLGIQDQEGNVEILSGVTEGEQVINIGLKQK